MDIIQIVIVGIISAILAVTLKKTNSEASLAISIMAGVIIFMMVASKLEAVVNILRVMTNNVDLDMSYINIIIKIIGIAYISEFGVQICTDAGESVIGSRIEFAGKILIMIISAPILLTLMQLVLNTFS